MFEVMVLPGASPTTYEPKSRQMAAIAKAKIYFSMGVPFEAVWLAKIVASNKTLRVVPMDRGIQKLSMTSLHTHEGADDQTGGQTYSPGKAGSTQHGVPDPHIWLSPPLVMLQARNILIALQDIDPQNRSEYETNYQRFMSSFWRWTKN